MHEYDPSIPPGAEDWLGAAEMERMRMVREYHENAEEPWGKSLEAHAVIHVIVENQIAMGAEPVPATVARLMRQGLDRHEAIHAVGAVLVGELTELQVNSQAIWDQGVYRRKLEKLTAKLWRKGQW